MKILLSFFLAVLFVLGGNAQITTYWTSNIPTKYLPTGATVPADTLLDGYTVSRQAFEVTLTPASTYDNDTETTAWTAIGAATKTAIDSNFVVEVWGLDEDADIIGRVLITNVTRRWDDFEPGNLPMQYTAALDVFRVTGYFEWAIEAP